MKTSAVRVPGVNHTIQENIANGAQLVAPFKQSELWFYRVNMHHAEHDRKQARAISTAVETLAWNSTQARKLQSLSVVGALVKHKCDL